MIRQDQLQGPAVVLLLLEIVDQVHRQEQLLPEMARLIPHEVTELHPLGRLELREVQAQRETEALLLQPGQQLQGVILLNRVVPLNQTTAIVRQGPEQQVLTNIEVQDLQERRRPDLRTRIDQVAILLQDLSLVLLRQDLLRVLLQRGHLQVDLRIVDLRIGVRVVIRHLLDHPPREAVLQVSRQNPTDRQVQVSHLQVHVRGLRQVLQDHQEADLELVEEVLQGLREVQSHLEAEAADRHIFHI